MGKLLLRNSKMICFVLILSVLSQIMAAEAKTTSYNDGGVLRIYEKGDLGIKKKTKSNAEGNKLAINEGETYLLTSETEKNIGHSSGAICYVKSIKWTGIRSEIKENDELYVTPNYPLEIRVRSGQLILNLDHEIHYEKVNYKSVTLKAGDTYKFIPTAEGVDVDYIGNAICNTCDVYGTEIAKEWRTDYYQNGLGTIHIANDKPLEISVIEGELSFIVDERVHFEKVDYDAVKVIVLSGNESCVVKNNSKRYTISFIHYNSSGKRYVINEKGETTVTYNDEDVDTFGYTYVDKTWKYENYKGVTILYLNHEKYKNSIIEAQENTIQEEKMVYHPFFLPSDKIEIPVGEKYEVEIKSNISGYNHDFSKWLWSLDGLGPKYISFSNNVITAEQKEEAWFKVYDSVHDIEREYPVKAIETNTSTTPPQPTKEAYDKKVVIGEYDDLGKKELKHEAIYSDKYFEKASTKKQGGLAKLSMLASATVYSKKYVKDFLGEKGCGFSKKLKSVDYDKKLTDINVVAFTIGLKKIKNVTVVAIIIRGTPGVFSDPREWISNLNFVEKGKDKTHKGFLKAETRLYRQLKEYLKKNVSGKVKFWVTGHSRGAAVGNLLAKRLNEKYGQSNVYAYTFATPNVAGKAKKKGYMNIKNYINPGDIVTEVPPSQWGYKRYGEDVLLTSKTKEAMKKNFKSIAGKKYVGLSEGEMKEILKEMLKEITKEISKESSQHIKNVIQLIRLIKQKFKSVERIIEKKIKKVIPKVEHAHCHTCYLSWLDAMYKVS